MSRAGSEAARSWDSRLLRFQPNPDSSRAVIFSGGWVPIRPARFAPSMSRLMGTVATAPTIAPRSRTFIWLALYVIVRMLEARALDGQEQALDGRLSEVILRGSQLRLAQQKLRDPHVAGRDRRSLLWSIGPYSRARDPGELQAQRLLPAGDRGADGARVRTPAV